MSRTPHQHTQRKNVRDAHRRLSEPVVQTMRLQSRPDDVRLTLMKAAWEEYDTVPQTCQQIYHPDTSVVVLVLPER